MGQGFFRIYIYIFIFCGAVRGCARSGLSYNRHEFSRVLNQALLIADFHKDIVPLSVDLSDDLILKSYSFYDTFFKRPLPRTKERDQQIAVRAQLKTKADLHTYYKGINARWRESKTTFERAQPDLISVYKKQWMGIGRKVKVILDELDLATRDEDLNAVELRCRHRAGIAEYVPDKKEQDKKIALALMRQARLSYTR